MVPKEFVGCRYSVGHCITSFLLLLCIYFFTPTLFLFNWGNCGKGPWHQCASTRAPLLGLECHIMLIHGQLPKCTKFDVKSSKNYFLLVRLAICWSEDMLQSQATTVGVKILDLGAFFDSKRAIFWSFGVILYTYIHFSNKCLILEIYLFYEKKNTIIFFSKYMYFTTIFLKSFLSSKLLYSNIFMQLFFYKYFYPNVIFF